MFSCLFHDLYLDTAHVFTSRKGGAMTVLVKVKVTESHYFTNDACEYFGGGY